MRAIDYFDKAAEDFSERIALIDGNTRYNYRELQEAAGKLSRAMRARGLADEDRVAIYSINDARVLICMIGLLGAGGAWVPVNYRNAAEANIDFLKYSETSWLFYHSNFLEEVKEIRARVKSLRHCICIDAKVGGDLSLDEFLEQGKGFEETEWGDPLGNPERMMGLVPTGGTTGPAKGVVVTNAAWGAFVEMAGHYWNCGGIAPICLSTAPLSHAAGVVAFALFTIGATNMVMPRFDAIEVLRNIERFRVTHMFLPPTALYALLAQPEVRKFDFSSLRVLLLAGSPVSPDRLKEAVEVFGPCVCQSYGQTEAPMLMTFLEAKTVAAAARGDHPERLRSCGKATYGVRLGIMDETGNLLPTGKTGEIVARGALVTAGYYKLTEATAEIRTHGWHHTGDVGYRDDDGFYYIVDRKKDMIISGGFNVFCAEVEACLMAMEEVYECAVIGVPDEKWGEAVKALVVLRAGHELSAEEVMAQCKAKLGGVKAPKTVEFRNEIVKTAAGKIDRKALRAAYWAGADREVH